MNILVVGGGGREHALGWAIKQTSAAQLLFAPGNAGTADLGENVAVSTSDVDALVQLAQRRGVDLVVVGPEVPLVLGLADRLEEAGVGVVGPSAGAARLEGSKAFAKSFMRRYGIPTADSRTYRRGEVDAAVAFARSLGERSVVKASGLAAGKGAVVCASADEAEQAVREMLGGDAFGEAADEVVVEAFMEGEEASLFVLTDGARYLLLPPAQDHKRIGEGDVGPNTGGMGAYAPAPVVTGGLLTQVCRDIVEPTLGGMQAEGTPYRGFLYVGLMLTPDGPRVVEYNCRMGDPETQAVLALVETDWARVFGAMARHDLSGVRLMGAQQHAATVVLASAGYPGAYAKGKPISGLEAAQATGALVFHAGTARDDAGRLVTNGGRVLAVTGRGATLREAVDQAYAGADAIAFEGKTLRRDIAHRAL
jgi:phosphoribosylamine--glycine ligase